MIIRARAPLRLGFAGGGTDLSPYCDLFGGYVLNTTIDRYAYAEIKILDEPIVRFISKENNLEESFNINDTILLNNGLNLHKSVYNYMIKNYNDEIPLSLELSTICDAPVGSGLGSSSSLVVAIIKAFVELLNLPLDDYSIAHLAFKIERVDCGLQGGRQDQYSATFGGFNFMEFYENDRSIINPLRVKNWIICELEASLLLFYTGVSRESAKIIADQSSNMLNNDKKTLEAMHCIKNEALIIKECLLSGNFKGIVDSLRKGWENKKKTANSVSNQSINQIYQAAIEAGALAGKLSGAGGGGFFMFYVPLSHRMNVIQTLAQFNGQISNCHFTKNGAQAWRIV